MLLAAASFIAFALLVWFKTDAVVEYADLTGLDNHFDFLSIYLHEKDKGSPQTLLEFLNSKHDSFIVRLVSCPICLATWLSIVMGIFCFPVLGFQTLALPYISLALYNILLKLIK